LKPVIFHPEARAELDASVTFYEELRPGLGLDFAAEVEAMVWAIRGDPGRWPTHQDSGLQKCKLARFPYNLFFLDLEDHLWIAAVAHQKRKPGYWKGRTPEI
jgi:toxin ParE1/3/4